MSNNKENNIKLHGIITKIWNDIKTKFGGYYTKTEVDPYRTVKDLTHLTTQKEIYDNVNLAESVKYLIKWNGHVVSTTLYTKTANSVALVGTEIENSLKIKSVRFTASHNSNNPLIVALTEWEVATPTTDDSATTKKYVDDEDAKKADLDLSNVNVGATNAGKFYSVSATGGLELVNGGGTWTEITDLWTNPDSFEKYKNYDIKISLDANNYGIITASTGSVMYAYTGSKYYASISKSVNNKATVAEIGSNNAGNEISVFRVEVK